MIVQDLIDILNGLESKDIAIEGPMVRQKI